ncbi:hypothetical protein MAP00_002725 [Monascus purpureus]|nr:hypothetical protein MAP00_002725 [Monascus purpureus]
MCVDSRVRKPVIFVVSPQDALGSRVQNLANISVSISLSLSLSLLTSNLHSWPSQWVGRLKQTRKRKRNNAIIAVNQPAIGSFPRAAETFEAERPASSETSSLLENEPPDSIGNRLRQALPS